MYPTDRVMLTTGVSLADPTHVMIAADIKNLRTTRYVRSVAIVSSPLSARSMTDVCPKHAIQQDR